MELQSGNTKFWSQSEILCPPVTLKCDRYTWKTIRHPFYATSSYLYHFVCLCEFKLELWSGKSPNWGKLCFDLCNLDLWPWPFAWTSCLSMEITNKISWWHDDRNIVKKDVTDERTDGKKCSQSCLVAAKRCDRIADTTPLSCRKSEMRITCCRSKTSNGVSLSRNSCYVLSHSMQVKLQNSISWLR